MKYDENHMMISFVTYKMTIHLHTENKISCWRMQRRDRDIHILNLKKDIMLYNDTVVKATDP